MDEADAKDKIISDKIDKVTEEHNKTSSFTHLMHYNRPCYVLFFAVFFAFIKGLMMPLIGVILSKLINYMAIPFEFLDYIAQYEEFEGTGIEFFKSKIIFFAGMMLLLATGLGLFGFLQYHSFGKLGGNVAY